jgi:hypothetical protein
MTLCSALLPSLFLAAGATYDERTVPADANHLVAGALAAEAVWQAFPGFVADLEIECDGKVSQGRLVVGRDGTVFVEQVPACHRVWAGELLGCVVRQRLPREQTAGKTWMFVNRRDERTPLGYAVCRSDAPLGPYFWIREQRLQAVEVRCARTKQRFTTLKSERNPDHKHLPTVQVLHRWNTQTLDLQWTRTTVLTWQRVGGFDLPATIQVLSAGTAAAPTTPAVGRLAVTRHQLLSFPQMLVASRQAGGIP